uniref:Uncharacterized protein n=1 Tax=viral metagenome TaxID=1070528 RepID=A0A6C0CPN1_9ZZZZ
MTNRSRVYPIPHEMQYTSSIEVIVHQPQEKNISHKIENLSEKNFLQNLVSFVCYIITDNSNSKADTDSISYNNDLSNAELGLCRKPIYKKNIV